MVDTGDTWRRAGYLRGLKRALEISEGVREQYRKEVSTRTPAAAYNMDGADLCAKRIRKALELLDRPTGVRPARVKKRCENEGQEDPDA